MKFRLFLPLLFIACACKTTDLESNQIPESQPEEEHRSYKVEEGSFLISKNTVFFNETFEGDVTIIDSVTISVMKDVAEGKNIKVGTIILYVGSGNYPEGFLGQVDYFDISDENYIYHTSPVSIDEAFDELDLEGEIVIPADFNYVTTFSDITIPCTVVDNSVWDSMIGYGMVADTNSIKTKGINIEKDFERTLAFKIEDLKLGNSANIEGSMYWSIGLYAKIKKKLGTPMEFSFEFKSKLGIKGELSLLETGIDVKFFDKGFNLPVRLVYGPFVFIPKIVIKSGIIFKSGYYFSSDMSYQIFNINSTCEFSNGKPYFDLNLGGDEDTYFKARSIEGKIETSLYGSIALEIASYGMSNILSVGTSVEDNQTIAYKVKASNDILLSDDNLFFENPELEHYHKDELKAYIHSDAFKVIGAKEGKFSISKSFDRKGRVSFFPEFLNKMIKRENNSIKAIASDGKDGFLNAEEHGFVLTEGSNIVKYQDLLKSKDKTERKMPYSEAIMTEFEIPYFSTDYKVQEYVKINDKRGTYYYYKDIEESNTCDSVRVEPVDLGLSVKWGNCNIGAVRPEEYGGYYAWGETQEKTSYTSENYLYRESDIGIDISTSIYDVANVKMGNMWKIPSLAEWEELTDNCNLEWTELNGVFGCKVTSKRLGYTDRWIFLPAAGYFGNMNVNLAGMCSIYWTSMVDEYDKNFARTCGLTSGGSTLYRLQKYVGLPIRPVSN